jgi:hypothetical protein
MKKIVDNWYQIWFQTQNASIPMIPDAIWLQFSIRIGVPGADHANLMVGKL